MYSLQEFWTSLILLRGGFCLSALYPALASNLFHAAIFSSITVLYVISSISSTTYTNSYTRSDCNRK